MSVNKQQLARLIAAYPAATVDEAMLETWMKRLGRYSPSIVTKTVDVLIDNCRFFPSVAEFSEMAGSEQTREKHAKSVGIRSRCDRCDAGWIEETGATEVNSSGTSYVKTSVKPCATCLPDTHQKWKSGEYEQRMAGHL